MYKSKLLSVSLMFVMLLTLVAARPTSVRAEGLFPQFPYWPPISGDAVYWCAAGRAPGDPSCTPGYADLASLYRAFWWGSQPVVAGTIWMRAGSDASGMSVVLSGADLSTWSNAAVTYQGGWNGVTDGTGTISGITTFNYSLWVAHWNADVTMNNFTVDGNDPSASLNVFTSRNIAVTDIKTSNTAGGGADLENAGGGTVVVNRSAFRRSSGYGLKIVSSGAVRLSEVTAHDIIAGPATMIDNTFASSESVDVSYSTFSASHGGLQIKTRGIVTLRGIFADSNVGIGADIDTSGVVTANVLVKDSQFNGNDSGGLHILTGGAVSVSTIIASDDSGEGLSIDTSAGGGAIDIDWSRFERDNTGVWFRTISGVTISCTNVQDTKPGAGIDANTPSTVTLSGVTFSNNTPGGDKQISGGGSFSTLAGDCAAKGSP